MKIIDEKGRFFGKVNVIDFLVILFLFCILPAFYYGYKILSKKPLAPVGGFQMSSQGKTSYENQTLNLAVSSGKKVTINFSGHRSSDPDGHIVGYEWKISGITVSQSRDFSYELGKGSQQINLTVKDNVGLENSVVGTVVVGDIFEEEKVTIIVKFERLMPEICDQIKA